jgi:hypothetical protein
MFPARESSESIVRSANFQARLSSNNLALNSGRKFYTHVNGLLFHLMRQCSTLNLEVVQKNKNNQHAETVDLAKPLSTKVR